MSALFITFPRYLENVTYNSIAYAAGIVETTRLQSAFVDVESYLSIGTSSKMFHFLLYCGHACAFIHSNTYLFLRYITKRTLCWLQNTMCVGRLYYIRISFPESRGSMNRVVLQRGLGVTVENHNTKKYQDELLRSFLVYQRNFANKKVQLNLVGFGGGPRTKLEKALPWQENRWSAFRITDNLKIKINQNKYNPKVYKQMALAKLKAMLNIFFF